VGNLELRLSVLTASRVNQSQPTGSASFVKVSIVEWFTYHWQSQKNSFQQEKLRKSDALILMNFRQEQGHRRMGVHDGGIAHHAPSQGETEEEVPFHKVSEVISWFIKIDLETNFLQLFAHAETSEWFSIISVISLEVNIVSEQKQA